MKVTVNLFFCLFIFIAFISCSDEEEMVEQPTETIILLKDGNLEEASHNWEFSNFNDEGVTNGYHVGNVNYENFMAPGNYSLSISSDSIGGSGNYSLWSYTIDVASIKNMDNNFDEKMKLVMKGNIKGENLQGEGVSIGFYKSDPTLEIFKTTEGVELITGTFDFQEYKLTSPFDLDTSTLFIYLTMLNTTGTVYFDNVQVYLEI